MKRSRKTVMVFENGNYLKTFPSANKAAKFAGVTHATVLRLIKTGEETQRKNGRKFSFDEAL